MRSSAITVALILIVVMATFSSTIIAANFPVAKADTTSVSNGSSISCSPNPANANCSITVTATVTGSNPTGTITWMSNSSTGIFSSNATPLASGTASTTYTDSSLSNATITAIYSGDTNNPSSATNTTIPIYNAIDFNFTGQVNFRDLTYFVDVYIYYYQSSGIILNPACDLNHDGRIDFLDLRLFVQDYIASWNAGNASGVGVDGVSQVTSNFSFSQNKPIISNDRDEKVAIVNGQRYVLCTNWTSGSGAVPIQIYSVDSNWQNPVYVCSSPSADNAIDLYVEVLGDNTNAITIVGTTSKTQFNQGFIARWTPNNGLGTWQWATVTIFGTDFLTNIYETGTTIVLQLSGTNSYFFQTTVANMFTPSSWSTINTPSSGLPSNGENRLTIFGNYVYCLRSNTGGWYWDIWRYNLINSQWDASPIMTNYDTSRGNSDPRIFPYIWSDSNMVIFTAPYSNNTWEIYWSKTGTSWSGFNIAALNGASGFAYYNASEVAPGQENHCFANDYNNTGNFIVVSLTQDDNVAGYNAIYTLSGTLIAKNTGYTCHSTDAYFIFDGDNIVSGGENEAANLYYPANVKVISVSPPAPLDTGTATFGDGFESALTTDWQIVNGTISQSTSHVHSGSSSAAVITSTTGAFAYVGEGLGTLGTGSYSNCGVREYVYPPSTSLNLASQDVQGEKVLGCGSSFTPYVSALIYNTGSACVWGVRYSQADNSTWQTIGSSTTVTMNAWSEVELDCSPTQIMLYVNDASILNVTGLQLTSFDYVFAGNNYGAANSNTIYIDDFESATGHIGLQQSTSQYSESYSSFSISSSSYLQYPTVADGYLWIVQSGGNNDLLKETLASPHTIVAACTANSGDFEDFNCLVKNGIIYLPGTTSAPAGMGIIHVINETTLTQITQYIASTVKYVVSAVYDPIHQDILFGTCSGPSGAEEQIIEVPISSSTNSSAYSEIIIAAPIYGTAEETQIGLLGGTVFVSTMADSGSNIGTTLYSSTSLSSWAQVWSYSGWTGQAGDFFPFLSSTGQYIAASGYNGTTAANTQSIIVYSHDGVNWNVYTVGLAKTSEEDHPSVEALYGSLFLYQESGRRTVETQVKPHNIYAFNASSGTLTYLYTLAGTTGYNDRPVAYDPTNGYVYTCDAINEGENPPGTVMSEMYQLNWNFTGY